MSIVFNTDFAIMDGERFLSNLRLKERQVIDVIKDCLDSRYSSWIAGGFVRDVLTRNKNHYDRNFEPNDIDIFTYSPEDYREKEEHPLVQKLILFHYKVVNRNENMITLKRKDYIKIQIMLRQPTFPAPKQANGVNPIWEDMIVNCLYDFHFTHCMMAYHPGANKLLTYNTAILDAMHKRIVINRILPNHAVDNIHKLSKYLNRGYTICAKESARLITALQGISQEQITNQSEFYWDGSLRQSSRFD